MNNMDMLQDPRAFRIIVWIENRPRVITWVAKVKKWHHLHQLLVGYPLDAVNPQSVASAMVHDNNSAGTVKQASSGIPWCVLSVKIIHIHGDWYHLAQIFHRLSFSISNWIILAAASGRESWSHSLTSCHSGRILFPPRSHTSSYLMQHFQRPHFER